MGHHPGAHIFIAKPYITQYALVVITSACLQPHFFVQNLVGKRLLRLLPPRLATFRRINALQPQFDGALFAAIADWLNPQGVTIRDAGHDGRSFLMSGLRIGCWNNDDE